MTTEICIEHRCPPAYAFVQRHGPDSLAILHDLIVHADQRDGQLVSHARSTSSTSPAPKSP